MHDSRYCGDVTVMPELPTIIVMVALISQGTSSVARNVFPSLRAVSCVKVVVDGAGLAESIARETSLVAAAASSSTSVDPSTDSVTCAAARCPALTAPSINPVPTSLVSVPAKKSRCLIPSGQHGAASAAAVLRETAEPPRPQLAVGQPRVYGSDTQSFSMYASGEPATDGDAEYKEATCGNMIKYVRE